MLFIGTCGFSYEDWRGVFYPETLSKKDFLAFYSQNFPALELNSSYYAMPSPVLVRNLAEYTPDSFSVAVKAYKGITHERSGESASLLDKFMLLLEPLRLSGKLSAVLLQFPQSFHFGETETAFLDELILRLENCPKVVEFRHLSWRRKRIWELLRLRGAALCCVDEPRLPGLLPPEAVRTSESLGYVRFHGRNSEKWWKHEESWERYDYDYSPEELESWRNSILWLADKTDRTFVFFNNHRSGNAVKNARLMAQVLGLFPPGTSGARTDSRPED